MARPKRICTVEGCGKAHFGLGYCGKHFARFKAHGSPFGGRAENGSALAWIRQHTSHSDDACLLWPFPSNTKGYGVTRFRERSVAASRIMCILAHGEPASPDLESAHSCGNSLCVNPRHLRWATSLENNHDKYEHGTSNTGSRNPMAKLNEEVVAEIRSLSGQISQRAIARRFGVSDGTISMVISGKRWTTS